MKKNILILSLCTVLLAGCGGGAVAEEEVVLRSVEVMALGTDSISSDFTYSGRAMASKEVAVMPTIPGKVIDFNYEVGDSVKENAVLFSVDTIDLQNNLRSTEASYQASKLGYDNAKKTYDNNKILFDQEIISEMDLDQMKFAYESAAAQLSALEVQMDVIKKNIADCAVKSPMTGVIATRGVERGGFATQSAPAYTVMDLSVIKVEVGVSEQTVNDIQVGDTVAVMMSAVSPEPLEGKISTVSPAANQTGTYMVKVELDNSKGMIKAGMLAEVSFTKEKSDNAMILPRNAVMTKNDETFVYIVEGTTAKRVVVTTGIETGENIEILTGLAEGDQVVTRGQTYLADGEQVSITNLPQDENAEAVDENTEGAAEDAGNTDEGAKGE